MKPIYIFNENQIQFKSIHAQMYNSSENLGVYCHENVKIKKM